MKSVPTAHDVLGQLALMSRRQQSRNGTGDMAARMHEYLSEHGSIAAAVPSVLRFWDDDDDNQRGAAEGQLAELRRRRPLPPVIKLLLLKLLYASPVSGASLRLACASVPYLAARFPLASPEGRALARGYKSHWAYYVFVFSLVLGERMKKHRRGRVWCTMFQCGMSCLA